jgi:rSAM/selenodomain-associated transferase 1
VRELPVSVERSATNRALIVMAKQPAVGNTKTRLCPPLTADQASSLYACFLQDTLELIGRLEGAQPVVAYWPLSAEDEFRRLAPQGFQFVPQHGPGLGERLDNVLTRCLQKGYQQVVAVDSDSPTLPLFYLRQAFSALDDPDVDVVLGPCDDGGYYLIGMKSPQPFLFRGMEMSTPTVAEDTIRLGRQHGLRFARLPSWYDVDTFRDLERLRAELASNRSQGPRHTAEFLSELRQGG